MNSARKVAILLLMMWACWTSADRSRSFPWLTRGASRRRSGCLRLRKSCGRCGGGPHLIADHTFEDCPAPDILIVPGGYGPAANCITRAHALDSSNSRHSRIGAFDLYRRVAVGQSRFARWVGKHHASRCHPAAALRCSANHRSRESAVCRLTARSWWPAESRPASI